MLLSPAARPHLAGVDQTLFLPSLGGPSCSRPNSVSRRLPHSGGFGSRFGTPLEPHTPQTSPGGDRADSLAFDAHKLVGLPVQCACFLARGQGQLRASHATGAAYLFQPDKLNASLDVGDGSIQCGRRNDALKLWPIRWLPYG